MDKIIKQKMSVSELKKRAYEEETSESFFEEEEVIPLLPNFLQEKTKHMGAFRGTAYHRILELLDFSKEYTKEDIELEAFPTKYIKQTIRSGQVINYEGNVVIIGDCHPGSEIRALGDITVWGVLSGIAHAGYRGNINAKVRALKMNAVQLRIANCYSRRPDSTNIPYIIRSSIFTPEEARVVDGEIMLFKINQN